MDFGRAFRKKNPSLSVRRTCISGSLLCVAYYYGMGVLSGVFNCKNEKRAAP